MLFRFAPMETGLAIPPTLLSRFDRRCLIACLRPPPRQTNRRGSVCRWSRNTPPIACNHIPSVELIAGDVFPDRISWTPFHYRVVLCDHCVLCGYPSDPCQCPPDGKQSGLRRSLLQLAFDLSNELLAAISFSIQAISSLVLSIMIVTRSITDFLS